MESKARSTDKVNATIERFSGFGEGAAGGGTFIFEAYDKDGNLKWRDEAKNLTTNVGRQLMNTEFFTGSNYTAAWYIGLVNNSPTPVYSVTNTMSDINTGGVWTETTDYSGSDRATADFGTATSANPSIIANTVASGGTVAAIQADSDVGAGATLPANASFIRCTNSGAGTGISNLLNLPAALVEADVDTGGTTHKIKFVDSTGATYYLMATTVAP